VTTSGKLTVAYAAQTVSNFGANREFRTWMCLADTGAGKLAGTTERISSRRMRPGQCPLCVISRREHYLVDRVHN
jgi:hypothetical protein